MSSAILTLLVSHILTFVESELLKEEPAILAALEADIQSLISKLEGLLSAKAPAVAAAVNPALKVASVVAVDAVQAAGTVLAGAPQ
jgi:hypothetical protein